NVTWGKPRRSWRRLARIPGNGNAVGDALRRRPGRGCGCSIPHRLAGSGPPNGAHVMAHCNGGTPSAEGVFRLIEAMARTERDRLFAMIEKPGLSDRWAVIPLDVLRLVMDGHRDLCRHLGKMVGLLVEYGNKDWARSKCSRVKRSTSAERDEAIDKAREVGIEEPEALLAHLKEHHPELVRNVRDAEIMMRDYWSRKN